MDRLPVASDGQVKVTLVSASPEPAERGNAAAPGVKRDVLLRWEAEAPAAGGAGAATVEYTFRIEYDRQMGLVGM